jgi:phosphatidylserine/phosphatidylglycerophosphate/cardiolipin synthase-like enzyme
MRQRSPDGPVSVRAIAGTHVVLLGMDVDAPVAKGLLGFGVERTDHTEGEAGPLSNFLLFARNDAGASPDYASLRNPVQEFVWGDYTAKPRHTYTYRVTAMHGTPAALTRGPFAEVRVDTEHPDDGTHGIYFNRGVVASQAYQRRFGAVPPSAVPNREAYKWLSRGLEEALIAYIGQAVDHRFALRAAVYQFDYDPVLAALKLASDAGADVQVVVHDVAKQGDNTPKSNQSAIARTGIEPLCSSRTNITIAHNKFIVLLRDGKPVEVWTGSTNVKEGGIFGHSNVGHRVSDPRVARRYLAYWTELRKNPRLPALNAVVDATPATFPGRRPRRNTQTTVFSPRSALEPLAWYCRMADTAKDAVFLTAAFGLTDEIAPVFAGERDYLRYLLLDLATSKVEAVRREPSNVVAAGGFQAKGGWKDWIAEGLRNLNGHVDYIHTKFMLIDPLSDDPIVITGSANWSDESIKRNDENMLVIRGDTRVADIYLTEFMRLFNHYRLRGKAAAAPEELEPGPGTSPQERGKLHLREDDGWAAPFFVPGSPEARERALFSSP